MRHLLMEMKVWLTHSSTCCLFQWLSTLCRAASYPNPMMVENTEKSGQGSVGNEAQTHPGHTAYSSGFLNCFTSVWKELTAWIWWTCNRNCYNFPSIALWAVMKSKTLLCLHISVHIILKKIRLNYVKGRKSTPSSMTSPSTEYQSKHVLIPEWFLN